MTIAEILQELTNQRFHSQQRAQLLGDAVGALEQLARLDRAGPIGEPATTVQVVPSVGTLVLETGTPAEPEKPKGRPVKKKATGRGRGRSRFDWVRGEALVRMGKSDQEVANELGCSDAAVYLQRRKHGWKRAEVAEPAPKERKPRAEPAPPKKYHRTLTGLTACPECGNSTIVDPCSHCGATVRP